MPPDLSLQLLLPVTHPQERGKVSTRRTASDYDSSRLNPEFCLAASQKTNRRFQVVNLRGKRGHRRKPVIHARNRPTMLHQFLEGHISFRARAPRSTVDPQNQGRALFPAREIEIKF